MAKGRTPLPVCSQCPWRTPHQDSFCTRENLTRLWEQIRQGGTAQSCHIEAGCPPDGKPRECAGAVILVHREIEAMAEGRTILPESMDRYRRRRRKGLTSDGILYWVLQRYSTGRLPPVDVSDPAVGLPAYLH